jgi:fused signal recognition particle receptor
MFKFLKERFSALKDKADDLDEEVFVEEKGKKLKEKRLDDFLGDLEYGLLQADVALAVVEEIKKNVREELLARKIRKGIGTNEIIETALKKAVANVLSVNPLKFDDFIEKQEKPIILMFVGVNGTGKTTVIAKFTHHLQKRHKTCVLAASDTFRAGAIEQLNVHADKLGVKLIKHKSGSDPAAVAYDAVEHARARRKDIVLIDTAGRMQTNINLMDEMKKIKRVAKPNRK